MRATLLAAAIAAIAATWFIPTTASAHGLLHILEKKYVAGHLCMTGHLHNGQSGAWRTEAEARQAAIRSWQGFIRFEHGRAWADYRIALQKTVKCTKTSDGQSSCTVKANACRR